MIQTLSIQIINNIDLLISLINQDIEDLKSGNSENMIDRNDQKKILVNNIQLTKKELDNQLITQIKQGQNIEQFRNSINNVESKLHQLNQKNSKLAYILLPLKDMYDGIIKDFFQENKSSVNYTA